MFRARAGTASVLRAAWLRGLGPGQAIFWQAVSLTSALRSMTMRVEAPYRMGNLGMPELLLILVLALLLFGPKKLPEIGRQLGKGLGEFKRASNDLKRSIEDEIEKVSKEEPSARAEVAEVKPSSAKATVDGTSTQPSDANPNHPA